MGLLSKPSCWSWQSCVYNNSTHYFVTDEGTERWIHPSDWPEVRECLRSGVKVYTHNGEEVLSETHLTMLQDIAANVLKGIRNPYQLLIPADWLSKLEAQAIQSIIDQQ